MEEASEGEDGPVYWAAASDCCAAQSTSATCSNTHHRHQLSPETVVFVLDPINRPSDIDDSDRQQQDFPSEEPALQPAVPTNKHTKWTRLRPMPHHHIAVVLLAVSLLLQATGAAANSQQIAFQNPLGRSLPFQKMVVDRASGRIYVGGVNRIYELGTDLSIRSEVRTGPAKDSPLCSGRKCSMPKNMTDAHTKVLAIDPFKQRLLVCTSLYQGRCWLRDLYNVSVVQPNAAESIPVVANDAAGSAVAVVSDGPHDKPAIYIASTIVHNEAAQNTLIRDEMPSVAALQHEANKLHEYNYASGSDNLIHRSFMRIEKDYRTTFRIEYVAAFASGQFTYFVARQPKFSGTHILQDTIESRLIRVCHSDYKFYSYTEMPLVCRANGVQYAYVRDAQLSKPAFDLANSMGLSTSDDILVGVFTRGGSGAAAQESAVCVYSIKQIDTTFFDNIKQCNKGNAVAGLYWFKKVERDCTRNSIKDDMLLCGTEVNPYIGGTLPVEAEAVLTRQGTTITAVTAAVTHQYTSVFLGTDKGLLLKGVIESAGSARVFDQTAVGTGQHVLPEMHMAAGGEQVLVLTTSSLYSVRVSDCGAYRTCTECLGVRNPYCGWCPTDNSCTQRKQCDLNNEAAQWIPYKDHKCSTITTVQPSQVQLGGVQYIELWIEHFPTLVDKDYSCVFSFVGRAPVSTAATRNDRGVRCSTPNTQLIPAIASQQHAVTAQLVVQADGKDGQRALQLASTNFTFYDCATYATCTGCAGGPYMCDWCIDDNKCTSQSEEQCRAQAIVNGLTRVGPSSAKGPDFCPRISTAEPEIYVAAGSAYTLRLQALNMQSRKHTPQFECRFTYEGVTRTRRAKQFSNGTIECEQQVFNYFTPGRGNGTAVAHVDVVWHGNKTLDNNQNISIIMYKCEQLARSCGLCITLDTRHYNCGWCVRDNQCTPDQRCADKALSGALADVRPWLSRDQQCPYPAILDFYPRSGPTRGGTLLTILGENLGRSFDDVRNAVWVSNQRCEPIEEEYVVASKIVCVTKAPQPTGEFGSSILVRLDDTNVIYANTSTAEYKTVNPVLNDFNPKEGPKSGGTELRITGEHLNAGSNVRVLVDGVECAVKARAYDYIICVTGPYIQSRAARAIGNVKVIIDNDQKSLASVRFTYQDDPVVSSTRPEESIVSGGLQIEVRGERFNLLQQPKMFAVLDREEPNGDVRKQKYYGDTCEVADPSTMFCVSPHLPFSSEHRQPTPTYSRPTDVDFGFALDGLVLETFVEAGSENRKLKIYPDPIIQPFDSLKYFRSDDHLTINGQYIALATQNNEITVMIGSAVCNVSSISDTVITCRPPQQQPDDDADDSAVVVRIGKYKRYEVGALSYKAAGPPPVLSIEVMTGIAVAVVIFIIAIIALLIAYRRKITSQDRQINQIMQLKNNIEMKVASECKEAFAELQTNFSFLSSADMSLGIPFLPYRDYVAQVVFPHASPVNHPVLRELEVDPQRAPFIEKGLTMFNNLLMNKTFVLHMIRCMEANKYFLSKDRVYVGSLLMIILQEKMEYCTDILKTLLAELIERTVERRLQPKVLFRRSESVAERMLAAWYTFLMHRYLLECAGRPLFMLYWALKQEIEKGPHDACTHESRYSLSEEKLLRATLEYHEMTVFVTADPGQSVEVPVRVLDCDTVTQVKEKCLDALYRTTPYSQRPTAQDLDLEWRTGGGGAGRMVLQDLDNTTRSEPGGWKKLNTLQHYKVPSNSSVALVPRQASMYNLSLRSEMSEKSSTFSMKNSPTLTRAFGKVQPEKDPDSGCKVYHLAKPHEANVHMDAVSMAVNKMASEIFLTRLITMKGTMIKIIEDLFESIFATAHRGSTLPLCIKYMFDFMDDQAALHGYTDPEVVHTWKSNSLPLRFWVNLIKNPYFVFDIPRADKIEGSLSVVAQTLMDACSTQDHQLTKDSPSSKLLFNNEMPMYREWVDHYYADIASIPPISDQDMNAFLAEESRNHVQQFYVYSALNELYKYVAQYKEQIAGALDDDEFAVRNRLPRKFTEMFAVMDGHLYNA